MESEDVLPRQARLDAPESGRQMGVSSSAVAKALNRRNIEAS